MPKDYRRGHDSKGQGWTPKRRHLWYSPRPDAGGPHLLCERANCGVVWRPWQIEKQKGECGGTDVVAVRTERGDHLGLDAGGVEVPAEPGLDGTGPAR